MAIFLSIPILALLTILQSGVISRMPLLLGTPDLLLLAVVAWSLQDRVQTAWHWAVVAGLLFGIYSALPFGLMLAAYLLITGLALLLKRRVWKAPVLAMLVTIFFGTFITHGVSIASMWLTGAGLPLLDALNLITLPSLLLNTLLAAPVYVLMGDLASWAYPQEIDI